LRIKERGKNAQKKGREISILRVPVGGDAGRSGEGTPLKTSARPTKGGKRPRKRERLCQDRYFMVRKSRLERGEGRPRHRETSAYKFPQKKGGGNQRSQNHKSQGPQAKKERKEKLESRLKGEGASSGLSRGNFYCGGEEGEEKKKNLIVAERDTAGPWNGRKGTNLGAATSLRFYEDKCPLGGGG